MIMAVHGDVQIDSQFHDCGHTEGLVRLPDLPEALSTLRLKVEFERELDDSRADAVLIEAKEVGAQR